MNNLLKIENIELGDNIIVENNIIKNVGLNKMTDGYFGTIAIKQDYARHTTVSRLGEVGDFENETLNYY